MWVGGALEEGVRVAREVSGGVGLELPPKGWSFKRQEGMRR